jgi:hypothetical protein
MDNKVVAPALLFKEGLEHYPADAWPVVARFQGNFLCLGKGKEFWMDWTTMLPCNIVASSHSLVCRAVWPGTHPAVVPVEVRHWRLAISWKRHILWLQKDQVCTGDGVRKLYAFSRLNLSVL